MLTSENSPCCVARFRAGDELPPVDALNRAGIVGVELILPKDTNSTFESTRQVIADACTRLTAAGLQMTALSLAPDAVRNIGTPDAGQREAAIRHLIAMMDLASVMGAKIITITAAVVHSEIGDVVNRYEDAYHFALKSMIDLRFEAASRCIRIACHLGRAGFLLSPIDSRQWIDQVNSPWVGSRLDPSVIAQHGAPADWMMTLGHRLFIADYPGSAVDHDPLIQQRIDWTELHRMVREIGNDAIICVDPHTESLESLIALTPRSPRGT